MDFVVAEPLLAGFCEFVGEGLNQVHSKLYFCFQSYAQRPACLAISNFLVGTFTSNNNIIILNIAYAQ